MRLQMRRPSAAMVVACLALLVALGGTSYATVLNVPKNSVGTVHLKKNAVISAKVKNRSLLAVDFKLGQLPSGPPGPKGDKGDKGDKGEKGDTGATGLSEYQIVTAADPVTNSFANEATVSCPAGKRAVGGGGRATSGTVNSPQGPFLTRSYPMADGTGWVVHQQRTTSASWTLTAYVVCAKVS